MKTTIVRCSISERRSPRHPDNEALFMFDHKGPFSIDAVNAFFDQNRHLPGWDQIRARWPIYTLKSAKRFWRWLDRKRPDQHMNYMGSIAGMP